MPDEQDILEDNGDEQDSRPASRLFIWLLALGIAALFLPLYLVSAAIGEATVPLQTELDSVQATLTTPPEVPSEEVALTEQLLALRAQLSLIEDAPSTLVAAHTDWPAIMAAVRSYDANRVRLTGFTHENERLTIAGNAVEERAVFEYSEVLEQTGLFSRVSVQSISISTQPTPTIAPTPASGLPFLTELSMPFVFALSVDLMRTANGSR
ncbi:MAG: PilN domain-containing protein [Chloroflexota bacterium]|nr:PilN domain-containing protein [Chloroflexota bacterium]